MRVGFRICGISYRDALPIAARLGFTDLEPEWSPAGSADFRPMAALASDLGIQLSAVITGADPMSLSDFETAFADCATVGATSFTAHPHPLAPDDQKDQDEFQARFAAAAALGRKMGVRLAVHSCGLDPVQWDLMFRLVPDLGLKYDPSFSAQAGRNYAAEIFKYARRIVHVHAKDEIPLGRETDFNSGVLRFTYAPAGMGQIQWGSVIAALYEIGYDGQIAIEPHSGYWCSTGYERGLVLAKRHLEQFFA